ncbi:MAG: hypothetical protein IPH26_01925 [Sterolibacteriaceae bacterium]|uniref:OmpR/PhoB-type domain-containing protein n=1 Tax=Candidatus Methylophosphatis roskildensis TaxID=2899263 RepID=A0A9D7HSI1_9PROT|nr:hypothetical protein [Candidatus Methylophosphatis roskildensis]MBK7234167.1 hypothetical protein [Sterolibacteriaceae bacterium]
MTKTICIDLLGGFALRRDGEPVVLSTRKAMALLAVLALRPSTVWQRERLAALLWSRSGEAQARGSLRQALAQLKKALDNPDGPVLDVLAEGLRLIPERVQVDATALERALTDAGIPALERVADLYAGDLLDGFSLDESPFEEWRRAEAARLRSQVLRELGRLLNHHVDTGDLDAATSLGERLLALEPASEESHQALMKLHLNRGALGSAMRQYDRCREALHTQLGVAPSAQTEALLRQIRARPDRAAPQEADTPPLLAVLPFANLSDDAAQGYFARGFTEDVIHELSRFRALRIIAAQSSFAAMEPHCAPRETAERLGARYALSGSVRRTARSIRLATELTDAASGHHLWAQRYDVPFEEIFDAQDDIARNVAGALAVRIDAERLKQAQHKPLASLHAYDCWLRGLACLRAATPDGLAEARLLFQRAVEADPGFARAYSGLSLTHFNDWSCLAWERWDETERQAFEYARQGVAIDDTDNVTQFILGRILLYRREFERAEHYLARAETLNPNDADTLAQLALAHTYLGRPEHGIDCVHLAIRLNPFHDDWYFAFAAVPHFFGRRIEEAIHFGLNAPDVATDVRAYLASAYAHLGHIDPARQQLALFLQFFRRNITSGREPEAGELVRWLLHVNPIKRPADATFLLEGLAQAGLDVPDALLAA